MEDFNDFCGNLQDYIILYCNRSIHAWTSPLKNLILYLYLSRVAFQLGHFECSERLLCSLSHFLLMFVDHKETLGIHHAGSLHIVGNLYLLKKHHCNKWWDSVFSISHWQSKTWNLREEWCLIIILLKQRIRLKYLLWIKQEFGVRE